MKKQRVRTNKAELYTIENFLNDEECDMIIKEIDRKSVRSQVSGGEYKSGSGVSNFRTSTTSSMKPKAFPSIKEIDKRISRSIQVPLELGEVTQGQKYEVGQEFKDHTDYFGKASLKGHGDKWGNRTWTFMIYLNDDLEGGETEFKKLGMKFKPKRGMALVWRDMIEGVVQPYTLHAGRPVREGTKYIITKWFREKPTGVYPLTPFFKRKYPDLVPNRKPVASSKDKLYTSPEDFPSFTKEGFKLVDVPQKTWALIQDTYKILKTLKRPEKFPNQKNVIYNKDKTESPVDILSLAHVKSVKTLIHEQLQPILEEWSGEKLIPTMIYGIRSYKNGAILAAHVDRIETHHISAIIIVDEDSNKPWPLDIRDHEGKWHKVYAKPGQMILYESVACKHGRLEEFEGNFFRNMFCHWKVADLKYVPKPKAKDVPKLRRKKSTATQSI